MMSVVITPSQGLVLLVDLQDLDKTKSNSVSCFFCEGVPRRCLKQQHSKVQCKELFVHPLTCLPGHWDPLQELIGTSLTGFNLNSNLCDQS